MAKRKDVPVEYEGRGIFTSFQVSVDPGMVKSVGSWFDLKREGCGKKFKAKRRQQRKRRAK